jgi:hypothetical protein
MTMPVAAAKGLALVGHGPDASGPTPASGSMVDDFTVGQGFYAPTGDFGAFENRQDGVLSVLLLAGLPAKGNGP